jgi:signal peptidase II
MSEPSKEEQAGPLAEGLLGDEPPRASSEPSGDLVPSSTAATEGKLAAARPSPAPSFVFFGCIAALSLALDVTSKAWAEVELTRRVHDGPIVLIENHLNLSLAYNRGGAWGLLQNASEAVRRPFFLGVSIAAIAFIVSLYGKLLPGQRALKWGLPLVLGGALGNLADRITRGSVVDFVDYRADWVEGLNKLLALVIDGWHVTDHWPTFNVADISICCGVALMALDMLTSRRRRAEPAAGKVSDSLASGRSAS